MRTYVRDLARRMEAHGMKRADLARKINASTAYVTKVMRGNANFTLETMTKLALAVDGRLDVRIVEKDAPMTLRNGYRGWHLNRGPGQDIASTSVTLKLNPD
jgi:transcriptional regulator with XRE-family HTH domain